MITLNDTNGASKICLDLIQKILNETNEQQKITAVEMRVAYCRGPESIRKLLGKRGIVYVIDTSEGHPEELAIDKDDFEARCMDFWYEDKKVW